MVNDLWIKSIKLKAFFKLIKDFYLPLHYVWLKFKSNLWFSTKRRGRWIIHLMWCQKWHRYLLVIYIGRSKEDIFLITFYGLYFSHHLHILKITILHTLDLCGQLSCTVSTPVFLTLCLYFCFKMSFESLTYLHVLCAGMVSIKIYANPSCPYQSTS